MVPSLLQRTSRPALECGPEEESDGLAKPVSSILET